MRPSKEPAKTDALLERYGTEAPAIDFVTAKASEQLSRVIEAAMNDPNTPQRPALGAVRAAVTRGVVARPVGEGAIDPDEDETLLGEIGHLSPVNQRSGGRGMMPQRQRAGA